MTEAGLLPVSCNEAGAGLRTVLKVRSSAASRPALICAVNRLAAPLRDVCIDTFSFVLGQHKAVGS